MVFKTVGDGVHAVFARAGDALAAALAAQRALHAEAWGETGPLRVRMALHTGWPRYAMATTSAQPLNRVARILALGHGGQILLSHATHDLVADDLPAQTTLRDLGEYPLKDLSRPEQIFQLVSPDLPADFPPLRTLDRATGTVVYACCGTTARHQTLRAAAAPAPRAASAPARSRAGRALTGQAHADRCPRGLWQDQLLANGSPPGLRAED